MRSLPFEGFLEALIRLAAIVPLPTDAMLEANEFSHAGSFLAFLEQEQQPEGSGLSLDEMLEAQRVEWSAVPDEAVGGSMPQRVAHLLDVLFRGIKQAKEADEPLAGLTRRDVRLWAMRTLGAQEHELSDSWTKEKQLGE